MYNGRDVGTYIYFGNIMVAPPFYRLSNGTYIAAVDIIPVVQVVKRWSNLDVALVRVSV